jgi:multiple sugar transport system substrate-binding protein
VNNWKNTIPKEETPIMTEKLMSKKLTRRQMLLVSGKSVLALAFLTSCGPAATQAPAQEESSAQGGGEQAEPAAAPVTLEFLAWGDPADIEAWDKLSSLYMERNPNVTVKVTSVADPNNNFYPKLQTSIAGGTPPSVSSFQGWEWQLFADSGVLAPIDDFVARDNFTAPYPEGIDSIEVSTRRNGKRYLIPLQLGTMVLFYAKKPFEEAGLPFPTDDMSLEEFLDAAEKLTDTSGDFRKFGLQANGSWFRDIQWIRSTGKQEFDEIVDPKKAQFNQPEIVEMLQLVAHDVYHSMKISPTPADLEGGANTIETGNVAMKYEGPWFFGRLNSPELRDENKQVEFDVVLMPQAADADRPHRGWAEGVTLPQSDNVEAAWGFASFMGGEEGDKIYSETTGRIPNSLDLVESFWIPTIKERFGVENGQVFIEAFKRSEVDVVGGIPRSKMWSEVVKPNGYDPMLGGSATAAEVLPKVDEELQKVLDEYWASVS